MEKQEALLAGTLLRMERLRQGMEQKAVCYGLCVPSYLCKIEQGTVCPDPALLSALFRRLGIEYTQDAGLLKTLRQALLDYFYRLEYGLNPQEVYASLQAQEEVLRHSPLAICWLLVQGCHGEAVLPLLEKLERAMTSRQLALYRLLRCRAQPQAPEALTWCREACQSLDCSAAMMELAFLYLLRGDYAAIHRMESRLVAAAVDEGNLFQLANYFFLNATAYACLNQEAMMLTYYQRCIRLLQNTGWQQFLGDTYYNMGATYISLKQYDLSLEYLARAEKIQGVSLALSHKKAVALLRSGQREEARAALRQMQALLDSEDATESDHLKYQEACMELEENYLDNPAYLELLERLIRALKQECHFGHLYFYREAVLDAYVRQRKYKKALAFEEEISLFVAKNGV